MGKQIRVPADRQEKKNKVKIEFMKALIISDIHANLEALLAIEDNFKDSEIDEIWFLGDVPDRGPNPVEALQWLNEHVNVENWIMGNHDAYVLDLADESDLESVDPRVLETNARQKNELLSSGVDLSLFKKAKTKAVIKSFGDKNYVLTHGSPSDPLGEIRTIFNWTTAALLEDEYQVLKSMTEATQRNAVCFLGHTHIPCLISLENGNGEFKHRPFCIEYFKPYDLNEANHWLINPGSAGSPRDFNHRSSCAVLDTEENTIIFHRVFYDVNRTASKLLKKGYDMLWADRLIDAEPPEETPDFWLDCFKNNFFRKGELL